MNKLPPLLTLLLLIVGQPALAYTEEERIRCGADAEKHCGGNAGQHCLASRLNSLSSACRTLLRERQEAHGQAPATPPQGAAPIPAREAVASSAPPEEEKKVPPLPPEKAREAGPCAQDVERLCTGPERERIGLCLKNHVDQLSPECRQKIRQRLAEETRKREWPPRKEWRAQ